MTAENYHARPEWSYSQMKWILNHGIDMAVALKNGELTQPLGKAVDIGQLIHESVLGGENKWVVKKYPDFRTKEAREWRDSIPDDIAIISEEEFETICKVSANVKAHPLYNKMFEDALKEQEYFATINGVSIRGKADLVAERKLKVLVADLKTTATFDDFRYKAFRMHYDLQAANYALLVGNKLKKPVENWFIVAETVKPFRVQLMMGTMAFVENGEKKLSTCIEKIKEFGDRQPNFLIEEVVELGDFSI